MPRMPPPFLTVGIDIGAGGGDATSIIVVKEGKIAMHLIIYGSEDTGKVTVNADGARVTLTKNAETGAWTPSNAGTWEMVRKACGAQLRGLLTTLAEDA